MHKLKKNTKLDIRFDQLHINDDKPNTGSDSETDSFASKSSSENSILSKKSSSESQNSTIRGSIKSVKGSIKSSLQTEASSNSRFSEIFKEKYEGREIDMQNYESTHLKATQDFYDDHCHVESHVNRACVSPRDIPKPLDNVPAVFKEMLDKINYGGTWKENNVLLVLLGLVLWLSGVSRDQFTPTVALFSSMLSFSCYFTFFQLFNTITRFSNSPT